eukprot:567308-Amphidinium_carterae.1
MKPTRAGSDTASVCIWLLLQGEEEQYTVTKNVSGLSVCSCTLHTLPLDTQHLKGMPACYYCTGYRHSDTLLLTNQDPSN